MLCPNCDAEMYRSLDDPQLWICEDCGCEVDEDSLD